MLLSYIDENTQRNYGLVPDLDCEFEEKSYEEPLNFELMLRGSLLFAPGQVLENKLGIDAALFSKNPVFWKFFNGSRWHFPFSAIHRPGVVIDSKWWNTFRQDQE